MIGTSVIRVHESSRTSGPVELITACISDEHIYDVARSPSPRVQTAQYDERAGGGPRLGAMTCRSGPPSPRRTGAQMPAATLRQEGGGRSHHRRAPSAVLLRMRLLHMLLPFPPFGLPGCRGLSCPDQTVQPQMIATPNHDRRPLWK